jgi:rhamnosyltransferase subunit B
MTRRILLSTIGSLGDLFPFIAMAVELKRRGHHPILATQPDYRNRVCDYGIEFCAIPPSFEEASAKTGLDQEQIVMKSISDAGFLLNEVIIPFAEPIYDRLRDLSRSCDLTIAQNINFGASMAASASGTPWIQVMLSPMYMQSARDPSVTGPAPFCFQPQSALAVILNRLFLKAVEFQVDRMLSPFADIRGRLGIPNSTKDYLFNFNRDSTPPERIVGLYSKHLAPKQPDHPDALEICGFPFLGPAEGGRDNLSEELISFLDRGPPPVVFTLGSFARYAPESFYISGLLACRELELRSVLICGQEQFSRFCKLAGEDTFLADYVPHELVFPRSALIVHQGGIGTSAQALKSGRPQIIVPFTGDQPDNARRLSLLGVGRQIPLRNFLHAQRAKDHMVKNISAIMESQAYAAAAQNAAMAILGENGAIKVADLVEAVLG